MADGQGGFDVRIQVPVHSYLNNNVSYIITYNSKAIRQKEETTFHDNGHLFCRNEVLEMTELILVFLFGASVHYTGTLEVVVSFCCTEVSWSSPNL